MLKYFAVAYFSTGKVTIFCPRTSQTVQLRPRNLDFKEIQEEFGHCLENMIVIVSEDFKNDVLNFKNLNEFCGEKLTFLHTEVNEDSGKLECFEFRLCDNICLRSKYKQFSEIKSPYKMCPVFSGNFKSLILSESYYDKFDPEYPFAMTQKVYDKYFLESLTGPSICGIFHKKTSARYQIRFSENVLVPSERIANFVEFHKEDSKSEDFPKEFRIFLEELKFMSLNIQIDNEHASEIIEKNKTDFSEGTFVIVRV